MSKYAIWNNKGGVGKSFLSFILSTEYAQKFSDKSVYILDLCPQANLSEILLGGNNKGSKELNKLIGARRTIGGYFDTRLTSPHTKTGDETSFSIQAKDYNASLTPNIYIIPGDPCLEVQSETINQIAGQTLPQDTWRNVHLWVRDLVISLEKKHPNSIFFIDCNPSFSAYTELALVAADKLIVPCSADGSSARALDNIGQLLYGIDVPSGYEGAVFSLRARKNRLPLPSIYFIPLNRSTQYNQQAAKAFTGMYDEIKNRAKHLFKSDPQILGNTSEDRVFCDIPDAHSVALVCSHLGRPLRQLQVGKHPVHGKDTQVNSGPLTRYKEAVGALVDSL